MGKPLQSPTKTEVRAKGQASNQDRYSHQTLTVEGSPRKNAIIEQRASLTNSKQSMLNGYVSQGVSDAGSGRMSNRMPFKYNAPVPKPKK